MLFHISHIASACAIFVLAIGAIRLWSCTKSGVTATIMAGAIAQLFGWLAYEFAPLMQKKIEMIRDQSGPLVIKSNVLQNVSHILIVSGHVAFAAAFLVYAFRTKRA
jgi:hypothetical protein